MPKLSCCLPVSPHALIMKHFLLVWEGAFSHLNVTVYGMDTRLIWSAMLNDLVFLFSEKALKKKFCILKGSECISGQKTVSEKNSKIISCLQWKEWSCWVQVHWFVFPGFMFHTETTFSLSQSKLFSDPPHHLGLLKYTLILRSVNWDLGWNSSQCHQHTKKLSHLPENWSNYPVQIFTMWVLNHCCSLPTLQGKVAHFK